MTNIVFAGPVGTVSGYGARSRDLCRALIKLGYDIQIIPLKWGNTPMTALEEGKDDDILSRIIFQMQKQPDIFINCTIPEEFQSPGRYNIGITAGIETNVAPASWIDGCNRMDLILTSSEHSKNVFEECHYEKKDNPQDILKLTTPIEVLFEGVDIDMFLNSDTKLSEFNDIKTLDSIPEDFNFLFAGTWIGGAALGQDRKNIATLIMNFINTFKTQDSEKELPGLVLKTNGAGFSYPEFCTVRKNINEIFNISKKADTEEYRYPNVYVLFGEMTDNEISALYHHDKIKCMVSYTKGEGFGRPLAEFSLTGKPIIATNWSGHVDFLRYATLLDGELKNVHPSNVNKWMMANSKWFNVDIEKARDVLINHFENYNSYKDNAEKQKEFIIENFSFDKMVEKLDEIIKPFTIQKEIEKIELPKIESDNED